MSLIQGSPNPSPPQGGRGGRVRAMADRLKAIAGRVAATPRLRGETGWVVANTLISFPLQFLMLKILTSYLGKASFGEFNLVQTAGMLVGGVLLTPMFQTYLRNYHTVLSKGGARSAGVFMLAWMAVVTVLVAAVVASLAGPLSRLVEMSALTIIAGGLYFVAARWLATGLNILDISRRRKTSTIHYLSRIAAECLLLLAVLGAGWRTSGAALLVCFVCEGVFAVLVMGPLVREIFSFRAGTTSRMVHMVVTFGLPYGMLEVFQWFQGFSDRYILAYLAGTEPAGQYVAAYQMAGVPFVLLQNFLYMLLLPIAYQRARDITDPRQVWSADKVLLGGLAVYLLAGLAFLPVYAIWGPPLLVILTTRSFAMPAAIIIVLAIGRYVHCMDGFFRSAFSVHNKVDRLLWYRLAGALVAVPVCWFAVRWKGMAGAAGGMLVSMVIYTVMVSFGPGGCFWLFRDDCRRFAARVAAVRSSTPAG